MSSAKNDNSQGLDVKRGITFEFEDVLVEIRESRHWTYTEQPVTKVSISVGRTEVEEFLFGDDRVNFLKTLRDYANDALFEEETADLPAV